MNFYLPKFVALDPKIKTLGYILCLLTLGLSSGCNSGGSREIVIECGGGADFQCPPGMYCELKENCGGLDRSGSCAVIPVNCPSDDDLVCGCDKKQYANACYANATGTTVAYEGTCIK